MDLSRRRRALRALARGLTLVAGLIIVVLWAGAAQADEPTTGSITVVVDASPNDAHDFTFTGCQGATDCGPFTLDDDDDGTRSDRTPATDLAPGTYTITQAAVPNWAVAISCDSGETIDLPNRRATISLAAGEDVTCTFTNTSASITIVQSSNPGDAHDFTYSSCLGSGCGTFTLDDDADPTHPSSVSGAGLAPGTYTITQNADTNWALTTLTCTTGESISVPNRRVTISLAAGEQTSCRFSTRAPAIGLVQHTSPEDPRPFSFTGCLGSGCSDFTMDRDPATEAPGSFRTTGLTVGTYTITQAPNANWPLTAISCPGETIDLANRRLTITLTKGEQASCSFTNTSASLTVIQDSTPDGPQDFRFERCRDADCAEVTLDDDADSTHPRTTGAVPLAPGTYSVTADAVDGYELASITCASTTTATLDLDNRRVTVSLAAGEQGTCTFVHRPPQPALAGVAQLSTNVLGSCARLFNGEARCWGTDEDLGRLGNGTSVSSTIPVVVSNSDGSGRLTGVEDISAGFSHSCVVLDSHDAKCWGHNSTGALGDGTTTKRPRPITVVNEAGTGPLTSVASISAAGYQTCALLVDGQARCWGDNSSGQLGDGTTTNRTRPVTVSNPSGTGPLTDIVQISARLSFGCALLGTGEARCWGSNSHGQLGDGTTTNRSRPVAVSDPSGSGPLTGIARIEVGYTNTCALLENGEARCWGQNQLGQLGDGTTANRFRPVPVLGPDGTGPLTGIGAITGGLTNCAHLLDDHTLCWGMEYHPDGPVARTLPEQMSNSAGDGPLTDVVAITSGDQMNCALTTANEVRCWGYNFGRLGDGTFMPRLRPVTVIDPATPPLEDVDEVSAGGVHTCARVAGGQARCWGSNTRGSLGDGTLSTSLVPQVVSATDGSGPLTGVAQISAGSDRTCAALETGQARCWGANPYGELGDGTTGTDRTRPIVVTSVTGTGTLDDVEEVSVGGSHTCARLNDGQARCWGQASALGDVVGAHSAVPVVVSDPTGSGPLAEVEQLSSGSFHSCAVLADAQVRCWGANAAGGLGDGTTTTALRPTVVSNPDGTGPLTDVLQVSAGHASTCAVLSNGQVRCWGENGWGQLGDDTTTDRERPVIVTDESGTGPLTGAVEVSVGYDQTCARLTSGQLRCWGGRPAVVLDTTGIAPLADVVDVSTTSTSRHVCATLTNGQARCWGLNGSGQIGDGTLLFRPRPAIVVDS